jgi:hypothetical protein
MEEDKFISKNRLKVILQEAPPSVDRSQLLKKFVDNGYTLEGYAPEQATKKKGIFGGDIKETFQGIKGAVTGAFGDVKEAFSHGDDQTFGESLFQAGGAIAGGASDVIGEGVKGAVKVALTQKKEDELKGAIGNIGSKVAESEKLQQLIAGYERLQEENPRAARNLEAALGFGELGLDVGTGAVGTKALTPVAKATVRKAKSLFPKGKVFKSADEVIEEAAKTLDDSVAGTREAAEAGAARLTIREKAVDLSPDVKKRLQKAGPVKTQEYFDIAHARNLDDTLPTPYEFAGDRVRSTVDTIEAQLQDTGSAIGKARAKYATLHAGVDSLKVIEDTFIGSLGKLNLKLQGGRVIQIPGKVTRVSGKNDIKVLNDIYSELKKVKQSPTLENIIDFRGVVDGKINFGKRAGEVSNSVDPLSRTVRKQVAASAARIVGKGEAKNLTRYSEVIDALSDIKGFTDRRAGAEYLLKLTLSGRGKESRKIIETIKQLTGVDLMDDATLMTLATDLIGNASQKNLFRQEIGKAGLDAARILSGDSSGLLSLFTRKAKDTLLDPEKIILKASKSGSAR